MHPMFCFVVLAAIVGIEGQLENVEPKKDDSTTGTGGLLENVDPKKAEKERIERARERIHKAMQGLSKAIEKELNDLRNISALVEVLDVGRCRKAVKDYCPCGWAKCVPRDDFACTNELTKCCPVNYDLKCCATIEESLKHCIKNHDKKHPESQASGVCFESCRREKVLPACNYCIKGASFYAVVRV
uniref:Uncharacterized protein n=1 Tax=Globodera rostochiensis TaxID=31243 RepID=A0A914GVB5_GLORO